MKKALRSALCISLLAVPASVLATPTTLGSNWIIYKVVDQNGVFASTFQVGQTLSALTTLEVNTPDSNPDPLFGQFNGAITSISLAMGSMTFFGSGSASTKNLSAYIFGQSATISNADLGELVFDAFADLQPQSSDSLSWMASAPQRIDSSYAWISIGNSVVHMQQQGSFKVSNVPVPAAAWLFGSALLGLMSVARRR